MDPKNKLSEPTTHWCVVWARFRDSQKDQTFIQKKDAVQYVSENFGGGHDPTDFAYTDITLGSGVIELVVEYYGRIIAVIISKTGDGEY